MILPCPRAERHGRISPAMVPQAWVVNHGALVHDRAGHTLQMIRLLAIDIDGTLLDSRGRLPAENLEAIEAVVARGVHVALATGRSYPFARPVAEPLPASVTLIVSNGAVERSMDGGTLARRLLPRAVARNVLVRTRIYRHLAALIFDRDDSRQMLYESMDWEHPARKGYWLQNKALIERCVPLLEGLDEDPIQVMFNGPVLLIRELAETMAAAAEGYALSLTEYEQRNFSLLDVTAVDTTKGRALAARARRMGLGRDEVMAIGDNLNDMDMLAFAGHPVVMGNAVAALKDRGWTLTGAQDKAGVAQAIHRLILGVT